MINSGQNKLTQTRWYCNDVILILNTLIFSVDSYLIHCDITKYLRFHGSWALRTRMWVFFFHHGRGKCWNPIMRCYIIIRFQINYILPTPFSFLHRPKFVSKICHLGHQKSSFLTDDFSFFTPFTEFFWFTLTLLTEVTGKDTLSRFSRCCVTNTFVPKLYRIRIFYQARPNKFYGPRRMDM